MVEQLPLPNFLSFISSYCLEMKPWNQGGKRPSHRMSTAWVSTNQLRMGSLCPLSMLRSPSICSIRFSFNLSDIFIFWYIAASICSIVSFSSALLTFNKPHYPSLKMQHSFTVTGRLAHFICLVSSYVNLVSIKGSIVWVYLPSQ